MLRGAEQLLFLRIAFAGSRTDAVTLSLSSLFSDTDQSVREASARFVVHLRDVDLEPYEPLLSAFIKSPAFEGEIAQVGFTLDRDPATP